MATAKSGSKPRKKAAPGAEAPEPKPAAAKKAATPKADKPKPETAEPPPRAESAAGAQQKQAPPFSGFADMLSADQIKVVETLSANLARAAVTAQGAIAEAALRQADRPAALTPDPFHVAPALNEVMTRLAAQPDRLMRAQADLFGQYMELWQSAARRASGEEVAPVVAPAAGDKRFNDPDWASNPMFDLMKQSYLLSSNWLNGLIAEVQGVDPAAKRRVEFFTKMLTDAFSPSNFLISNPAALREVVQTQGQSLVRGMENFAADLERGGGQLAISQTDLAKFKVGENVATAPGKVVYQNDILQLLQFDPTTETVCEIPLLIFPPWINKFYILDLRPENSMIRWLTGQGFTVFVASWVNPDQQLAAKTFEDYMLEGVYDATQQVMTQCGVDKVNTVGYCIGGTLLSVALAHMAARGDQRINSTTFFAAQQDFAEAGDLLLFTNEEWLQSIEQQMDAAGGFLPSQSMADTFNALRGNDLIWSFFVSNYLMGKEPRPFDLLFWNADQTRMPKSLHLFYLRNFYKDNALTTGQLSLGGEHLDLSKVKTPIYVQSSKDDHIAPFRSVYRGAKAFGGPVTFTMAGSGHIAGVINHPDARKYQHWTNAALPGEVGEWIAGAQENPGSWWPHWAEWLRAKSGSQVPARDPAKGKLKPLENAPGSFVLVKSQV
ncbi:class I poly(R)-hydroxyalkanoic acid synthase [Caulobacter sp. RHG1]|uniref:class I poly(R)-hydroxyalkanoic acid synthase n=1 Tax=Caulobacter sp. (strain RHG1) TaxID=2545762 RepID=UPI001555DC4F|nr:class I poly(R)-hydroxyalkanoic acid synthase [Caulobacter sp. RHG1]NQE61535.1 Polyhydroxyalkanoic acid synthase [Caulobacter sp. RHG1]